MGGVKGQESQHISRRAEGKVLGLVEVGLHQRDVWWQ